MTFGEVIGLLVFIGLVYVLFNAKKYSRVVRDWWRRKRDGWR